MKRFVRVLLLVFVVSTIHALIRNFIGWEPLPTARLLFEQGAVVMYLLVIALDDMTLR